MSGWSFAWSGDETQEGTRAGGSRIAACLGYGVVTLLGGWLVLFLGGVVTTLGSAQGSERHGSSGVRRIENSSFGLPSMYLARGQKAWWDYDVQVEGEGGIRLTVSKAVPSHDFIVKVRHLRTGGRGRFEVVAPASGFYNFSCEHEPIGRLFGPGEPGSTRYKLSWGVD